MPCGIWRVFPFSQSAVSRLVTLFLCNISWRRRRGGGGMLMKKRASLVVPFFSFFNFQKWVRGFFSISFLSRREKGRKCRWQYWTKGVDVCWLQDGKRPLEKTFKKNPSWDFCKREGRGRVTCWWDLPLSLENLSNAKDFGRGRPPRSKPKPVGLDQAYTLHLEIALF